MKKSFVCVCTGTKYGPEYVNTLYNMVVRHSNDVEFNLITDSEKNVNPNIKQRIVKPLYKTWWNKVHMFRDDIGLEGKIIFMDLDVVIINNIDHLWDFEGDAFVIIQDFNRCRIKDYKTRNSSVMKFNAGQEVDMWNKFKDNYEKIMSSFAGDQNYVTAERPQSAMWPREWIMSYKWEIGMIKGDPSYSRNDVIGRRELPEDCCVAVFHGKPNPAEIKLDTLITENYR